MIRLGLILCCLACIWLERRINKLADRIKKLEGKP